MCLALFAVLALIVWVAGNRAMLVLIAVASGLHLGVAGWRWLLLWASRRPGPEPGLAPDDGTLPTYAIVAALLDEADVLPQLVERLSRIDYPADRLEGWLMLEAHDRKTIAAAKSLTLPNWLKVHICPPGQPRTKPRALNIALRKVQSEFLVVFDAEDEPDPGQLREAVHRFRLDPAMACLQAPLRIRPPLARRSPFIDRQFALEYAGQFEVILPGMSRLGLPFPLGGTSNHLRVSALREVGGWDAHNVTEDADLGFRLWRAGGKLDVLTRPTWETPPEGTEQWLPQRTRWLKGYVQTFGVHTRWPLRMDWRGWLALVMTLGQAIVAAFLHGPTLLWVAGMLMVAAAAGLSPLLPVGPMVVLAMGWTVASVTGWVGARHAGIEWELRDFLTAPVYWAMFSVALCNSAWQLLRAPYHWDKTKHVPETRTAQPAANSVKAATGRLAA